MLSTKKLATRLLVWTASAVPAVAASDAGSLLVYPCYDNRSGATSVLTVVNTHPSGSIAVELVYIDGEACLELNRTVVLTAKDTFSAVTRLHNPDTTEGFVYAFAKHSLTGAASSWNHLVGSLDLYSGFNQLGYRVQPYVFRSGIPEGQATDLDLDGVRDLNGAEYETAPDVIVVAHFLGNHNLFGLNVEGTLVVLGLTGIHHRTLVDLAIYNDNEEMFSSQLELDCWDRVRLSAVSDAFRDDFLRRSNHDPLETPGLAEETGWYELDGNTAYSSTDVEPDPALLALHVEASGLFRSTVADLPFARGRQANGDLLPTSLFGDAGDEPAANTLYGSGLFTMVLVTIDPLTGDGTVVGSIGSGQVAGLAMDPDAGVLYGSTTDTDELVRIDPATGAGTVVGALGFTNVQGLAFDPVTDTLYGVDVGSDQLITINRSTGAGAAVGALGFDNVRGLELDPLTGTLYGTDAASDQLIRINRSSGAGTAVGALGFDNPRGLAFDPATGTLFGTDELNLITIDPATGAGTLVGQVLRDVIGGLAIGPAAP